MKNTMKTMTKKRKSKKGFTLMEMLIVIAIIAILVAIAIPIFNAQLNKAEDAVDEANKRSAQSMAYAQYLLDDPKESVYYVDIDNQEYMTVTTTLGALTKYKVDIGTNGVTSVSAINKK